MPDTHTSIIGKPTPMCKITSTATHRSEKNTEIYL